MSSPPRFQPDSLTAGELLLNPPLLEGLATTRAIRRYEDAPIPSEDLSRILFSASRAPTGSNRQDFRFLCLIDGPNAIKAKSLLGESFRAGWRSKQQSDGYVEETASREPWPNPASTDRRISFR